MAGTPTPEDNNNQPKLSEIDAENAAFKNRRRMAWVSLVVMIVWGSWLYFFVDPTNLDKYASINNFIFGAFALIVMGYMGSATVYYYNRRNN
jgi:hypothetical protein